MCPLVPTHGTSMKLNSNCVSQTSAVPTMPAYSGIVPRSTFTPATSTCCSPSIMTNSFDANLRPPRIPVEDDIRRQPDGDGPVPVAAHQRDIERVFFVERVLDHPHAGDEE